MGNKTFFLFDSFGGMKPEHLVGDQKLALANHTALKKTAQCVVVLGVAAKLIHLNCGFGTTGLSTSGCPTQGAMMSKQ
jgi:hypothetical protein